MPSPVRQIGLFLSVVIPAALLLPAANLALTTKSVEHLYDIDFALPVVDTMLRGLGISALPDQVVVGKSGWLFLGDHYERSITMKRRPATADEAAAARARAESALAWGKWMTAHGVRSWHVLVCADKDSIYPDFVPQWDVPANGTAIDALMAQAGPRVYVDSRPVLRAARSIAGPPLYLRTDTHWTARGAWIAYRALARSAQQESPGFAWLQEGDVAIEASERASGDLAGMLYVNDALPDASATADIAGGLDAQRLAVDTLVNRTIPLERAAKFGAGRPPALIRSPHALNGQRLLWLRDSFGEAMLPYLAATFGEIVEVPRESVGARRLARLVAQFKPDAVLDAVVERNARVDQYGVPPPASAE